MHFKFNPYFFPTHLPVPASLYGNNIGPEGIRVLCDVLRNNTTITVLKWVEGGEGKEVEVERGYGCLTPFWSIYFCIHTTYDSTL